MPSCNRYRLTWVSLTLDEGYLLMADPPDLEHSVASLALLPPPVAAAPWAWGCSSRLLSLTSGVW